MENNFKIVGGKENYFQCYSLPQLPASNTMADLNVSGVLCSLFILFLGVGSLGTNISLCFTFLQMLVRLWKMGMSFLPSGSL